MKPMRRFVKDSRDRLALSQDAFGDKLGVDRRTIYRYEHGDPVPESIRLAILRLLDEAGVSKQQKTA